MSEQQMYVVLHCEPCEECVQEDWQFIEDGELRWRGYEHCPRYEAYACDDGRGVPAPWIRERILAREGASTSRSADPAGCPSPCCAGCTG
ncbi:hypothetical protein [Streptomyces sp. NPDC088748]|uniref:hypothetical protein n=1 Tax=Streptomyces sp. NPDC088748 TaxID=3365887 RepID=UPI003815A9DC